MDYRDFEKAVFDRSAALGCSAAEAVFVEGDNFNVNILDAEIDSYTVSRKFGFGLRVKFDGRDGYAYTEVLEDPEALCLRAIDNARSVSSTDDCPMQGRQEYTEVTPPPQPVCDMTEAQKIALALELERAAKALDPRVQRMEHDRVVTGTSRVRISNTLGLDAQRTNTFAYGYLIPVVGEADDLRNGVAFRSGAELLDTGSLAREAVEDAMSQLGAKSITAGEYRLLIKNLAAIDILEAFSGIFSAERSQRGLSPLTGREGEKIAAGIVSIIDDPLHAANPRTFDDEGTPSVAKTVVDSGFFKSFLHNLKTAKKAGVITTSNGSRGSAASPVDVAPSNFYIAPDAPDYDELVKSLGDGIIVAEVSGLHAGVNPVTGEFSLLSRGFLVENGKIVRPVEQITIAGTIFDLLSKVEAVGSDLRFSLPVGEMYGSPSLLVGKMMLSGNE